MSALVAAPEIVPHGANARALPSDNTHLSEPSTGAVCDQDSDGMHEAKLAASGPLFAIDCKSDLDDAVRGFVEAGIAQATRRAYRADLEHFADWGGSVPATDVQLAGYVAAHAATLSVATLVRRLASISVAHEARGYPNPAKSPLVRATMRGIRRDHGRAQRQARPLLKEDLLAVLAAMGGAPRDLRDRALLLIGFAGGFRRSEIIAIDCNHVERVRQGVVVTLRKSKTDQEGVGRKLGIPLGRSKACPCGALDDWLAIAGISEGPVFRPVDRQGRVASGRLSREAVSIIVKDRIAAAGIDPTGYSGHSLRAGLATSAAMAGVSMLKIRAQTGHASDAMLGRYIRDGELFVDNAAGALL